MNAVQRPFPLPDEYSAPFFAHLAEGRLTLQHCRACGTAQLGQSACFRCGNGQLDSRDASGVGVVHTFVIMHICYHRAFADEIPYNAAIVELEEGPRLATNILGVTHGNLRIGLRVQAEVVEIQSGVFMPFFRAADRPGSRSGSTSSFRMDGTWTL